MPKQQQRETKKQQRARARNARYRQRQREHSHSPAEQHKHARDHLMAAVRNSRTPARHVRRLVGEYEQDLRDLLARTHLGPKQRDAFTSRLHGRRDQLAHLSQTLRLLRAAVDQLPEPGLVARTHAHYAECLSAEARRIDAELMKPGGDAHAAAR